MEQEKEKVVTEKVADEPMTVQDKLDSWDNFISGTFLKSINVNSPNDAYVCIATDIASINDSERPRLTLERNGIEWEFDLNKTNAQKIKELGIASPKACVGKKFYFNKVLVRNPQTNREVEGLRIARIE